MGGTLFRKMQGFGRGGILDSRNGMNVRIVIGRMWKIACLLDKTGIIA